MPEICPYCGKEFANTKALGSHVHYIHETKNSTPTYAPDSRSDTDQERFQTLWESCMSDRGLPLPPHIEKIERALAEIPPGVSPLLDQYRNGFACAGEKEKRLKEIEALLMEALLKEKKTE